MKKVPTLIALAVLVSITAPAGDHPRSIKVGEFPQQTVTKYELPGGAEVFDVAVCGNSIYAAAGKRTPSESNPLSFTVKAYVFEDSDWTEYNADEANDGVGSIACDDSNFTRILSGGYPSLYTTKHVDVDLAQLLVGLTVTHVGAVDACGHPELRDDHGNQLLAISSEGGCSSGGLWFFTDDKGFIIDGKHGGLPFNDAISLAASDNVLWVGTTMGAARWDSVEWRYLQGLEYLPDDHVIDVAIAPDGSAWLATPQGVSRVQYLPMTLAEKAAHYEAATRARHVRHDLISDSELEVPGEVSSSHVKTSDNDGLWTAMYIAAESYRWAVTNDPQAKKFARDSMQALLFLETVNEIPGFVSRSFALPDEPHGTGEWDHITSDGKWRWKGDTSSDEIIGHYYAYSIYYDLVANEEEKEQIREKVRLITDYMLDHDLYLIDTDGEPTTWGHWNFKGYRRFRPDRGLNSLEMLAQLKAAFHVTGDQKYQDAYLDLAVKHDYAKFTVRQKINIPPEINHSDDELAFLSYYPLLKYEQDPKLLNYYHASLRRSFKIDRPEKCPLWNFIYGAVMPPDEDFALADAVWTLERTSLTLVRFDHVNSKRDDVRLSLTRGRFGERESVTVLPPDERSVMKWNGNPYALDTGQHGKNEEAGTYWLLPYWMGRYYGFIRE